MSKLNGWLSSSFLGTMWFLLFVQVLDCVTTQVGFRWFNAQEMNPFLGPLISRFEVVWQPIATIVLAKGMLIAALLEIFIFRNRLQHFPQLVWKVNLFFLFICGSNIIMIFRGMGWIHF